MLKRLFTSILAVVIFFWGTLLATPVQAQPSVQSGSNQRTPQTPKSKIVISTTPKAPKTQPPPASKPQPPGGSTDIPKK